jgi:hypothetical protein
MPRTDPDPLGDGFKWRLRAELNRVRPLYSSPRYLSPARNRIGTWRFAPAGLAAGVASLLALTAFAATGSPNPVVWTEKIVTTIETQPAPEPTSTQEPTPEPSRHAPPPASPNEAQPSQEAEPSQRSEPSPTPEHGDDGGGTGDRSTAPPALPSPSPGDH